MKNPIKAYANLNQANRRWVTFAAGAAVAATAGSALVAPIAYGAAIADGYHFHKEKKVGGRIRAGLLTLLVAASGAGIVDGIKESATVAEAPAPVEQVVEVAEAPAPVVITPANEAPSTVAEVAPAAQPTPPVVPACDYGRFYDNPCAHTKGADMARTYAEARRFVDGQVVEVCFNGDYTKQYYSRTCSLVWNKG